MNIVPALFMAGLVFTVVQHLEASTQAIFISPDQAHNISFIPLRPGSFEIRDAKGGTAYSSASDAELKNQIVSNPEPRVLWSRDSNMVAVTFGYHFLIHTHIFVRDGSKFVRVSLPTLADKFDNVWILPEQWTAKSVLHLKISGPHAGKAHGYYYEGKATVQVKAPAPFQCIKLTEEIESSTDK